MENIDLKSVLNDAENDLTNGIQQVTYVLNLLVENVENLKIKTSKPDKATAQALLEYIAMEESKAKTNMEILCGKEIQQYMKWLDEYCKENSCSQEQALEDIIGSKI